MGTTNHEQSTHQVFRALQTIALESRRRRIRREGYRNDDVIAHALRLVEHMPDLSTEPECMGWRRFLDIDLFSHFSFHHRFSSSNNLQWTYDDMPGVQARSSLIAPEPDFAFGIKADYGSVEANLAQRMHEVSEPAVSASCIPSDPLRIVFPFLVLESMSLQGDALTANHQMANGMIKALDVVAAAGQEKELCVIGICQIGFSFELYLGYCTTDRSSIKKPRKYVIDKLSTGNFCDLQDMIQFLRFLEAAGNYGEHIFCNKLISSLETLCDSAVQAQDAMEVHANESK